jgi:phage terminase large subunit
VTSLASILGDARRDLEVSLAAETDRSRYAADPVAYARDVLGFEPWSKQREILESVRDHKRTAVRSSHGTGKTAIAGRVALWFLDCFPGSRVITTAPTWTQVKNLLWREIHVAHYAAGDRRHPVGKLHDTGLEMAPDWFAVGFSTNEPERFQGHHAEHLLLIVDEASGVSDAIFNAAQGFLTAHGARLLLLGNPTQLAGEFFDAFHSKRAGYERIAISTLDTPAYTAEQVPDVVLRSLPTREWVDEMRRLYGEESPLWSVRVMGEFARQPDDSVMALAALEAAQAREAKPGRPLVVACDVARFGSDETVIAIRHGDRIRIWWVARGKDTMQTTGWLMQAIDEVKAEEGEYPLVVIDDAGVGGGVTDRLREVARTRGTTKIVAFNGAERAIRRDDFPNRRSEAWFAFAEKLPELDLDADEQLAADLLAPRYRLDSQARRVVEPKAETKKRLGRSPDRADAVLMTLVAQPSRSSGVISADDELEGVNDPGVRYDMSL